MRGKYSSTLDESKKLNATGLMKKANANNITADKLLYDHAIQMVSISRISKILKKLQLTFNFSASQQLWMNYLETRKIALFATSQLKFYYIRWPKRALTQMIKCCYVNVSFKFLHQQVYLTNFVPKFLNSR